MSSSSHSEILQRIQVALEAAREVLGRFTAGDIEAEYKAGHDPVTEADRSVDAILRDTLLRDGEGWLSEEAVDDFSRQPQRGKTRRVEGVRKSWISNTPDRVGCLQASVRFGGIGRCYFHFDSEARMGCRGWRCSGAERRRFRCYSGKYPAPLQP